MADILDDVKNRLSGIVPLEVLIPALNEVRQKWSGETVYVLRIDRGARDARIMKMLREGSSLRHAAMAVGVAPSTVRRIAGRQWRDDRV